jgi:glycosyltransferase involved in cell wall biosynthesis
MRFFLLHLRSGKGTKMNENRKPLRVLWFANTPGLSAKNVRVGVPVGGAGWISSLQSAVEDRADCHLGFVFYSEELLEPFEYQKTWYFPVQKLGNTKKKRLLNRIAVRTEYDENVPNFLKAIGLFKPDIIHVHGTEFSFGLITGHIKHIPVVVSIQGNLTVYDKKYFSGMTMPGLIRRLKSGYPFFLSDYKIWRKRVLIEQEILRKTAFIFGRTDWDRRISLALAPGAHYYHVDEVIRPAFYQLGRGQLGKNHLERKLEGGQLDRGPGSGAVPVFFTTSSPSFYKGFETVIDTARILAGNGIAFTWLVAGLKEGDALVKMIRQWKGAGDLGALNIRLLGVLSEEELMKQLLEAAIYVQVSHIENSPNSLCEAMLAGLPIIASFAGGTSSLIKDGVNGVLVQDGDPYALAGALQEMMQRPEQYLPMAAAARSAALRRHDPGAIVKGMLESYADIIERHALKEARALAGGYGVGADGVNGDQGAGK